MLRAARPPSCGSTPNAFGNALAYSLAGGNSSYHGEGTAARPYVDPITGEHIIFGKPYEPNFPQLNQFVSAFAGAPSPVDRSKDVQVAAGDRLKLTGIASDTDDDAYYAGIIAKLQERDLQRSAEQARRSSWIASENAVGADVQFKLGTAPIRETVVTAPIHIADDPTPAYLPGVGHTDETHTFPVVTISASTSDIVGALLDEGLQRTGGTILGVAGYMHGGAQFFSDQFWTLTNALSGNTLASNHRNVQDAVARNAALGQVILGAPRQIAGFALRAVTGNWNGAERGVNNALNIDQIRAANARGDYLSAQILTTQSALNVAGVAALPLGGYALTPSPVLAGGTAIRRGLTGNVRQYSGGLPAIEGSAYSPNTVNLRSNEFYQAYGDNPLRGTMSSLDTRKWYRAEDAQILNRIDLTAPLEFQAKQAFDLRNTIRTQARELMNDRITADRLMREEPNMTWEQMIRHKQGQELVGDDIYRSILQSSQKTRAEVNRLYGLE